MNRIEIKNRILNGINDDPDSSVFYTTAQIEALIDEGLEVLAEDTMAINRTAVVPVRQGAFLYYLPWIDPDAMAIRRVWYQNDQSRLTAVTMSQLDGFHQRWLTVTGTPEVWFPVSWDIFGVWPIPATAGDVLRVAYSAWPRALQDDSDEPELPEATQDAVVLYGQYQGILKKWDAEQAGLTLRLLTGHRALAGSRSAIARIASRVWHRTQTPHPQFPSDVPQKGDL